MKDILTILAELEIEIPEDKKATINKAVLENYKTVADYNKVTAKRDEYKTSLEDVQGKLEAFKDVNVDELQGQITALTNDLDNEKKARAEDARKSELVKNVETFLSDKKFVNAITQESIKTKLAEELDKDTARGKSIADIFNSLVTDAEGKPLENILISESQQKAEEGKAKFTSKKMGNSNTGPITKADFKAMTLDERTALNESDPELYRSLKQ